jgi:hypothetical protein
MEQRISEQTKRVEELERSGGDPTEAKSRLQLLEHALGEMRIQLTHLSPTRRDNERRKQAVLPKGQAGKRD